MVVQPFKAGVMTRRLKPAATVCRHSVTQCALWAIPLNQQNFAVTVLTLKATLG